MTETVTDDAALGRLADAMIAIREMREAEFPKELFDEYAWDLMLYLFSAQMRGEPMTTDALAHSCGRSSAVCKRWISHLDQSDQISIDDDNVTLSADGESAMRHFLIKARDVGIASVEPA